MSYELYTLICVRITQKKKGEIIVDKKKTSVNMLEGSIFKSLVIFMIPILISNIFQQFYNTMDTAIVGNTLGMTSLSAIGSCAAV